MSDRIFELVDLLVKNHSLTLFQYQELIKNRNEKVADYIAKKAIDVRKKIYANTVYIRGLIEISNICKNDCLYCGIRRSNKECERYRLTPEEIFECCEEGYSLGFRTFVLQGGEDCCRKFPW